MVDSEVFQTAFDTFYVGCIKIYQEYCDRCGFLSKDTFRFDVGSKYVKVVCGTGVFCFVDKTNGNVLKHANWKAPAKHARGNILDAQNGLSWIGPFGPAYLR